SEHSKIFNTKISHLKRGNYIFFKDYADLMHKYTKTAPNIHRVCMVLDFAEKHINKKKQRPVCIAGLAHAE
ncbi:MAG: hypothetical protein IKG19_07275, partial [Lachnospiraceae bacterium]|nr:hypothetical protein [Lachnospiraceae bacterium]